MNRRHCICKVFAALTLLTAGGCSQSADDGRPRPVPVSGTVLYNRQPVEGATVVFVPEEHMYAAAGRSRTGGSLQLRTFDEDDGAIPGKYTVTVRKFEFLYPPGGGEIERQLLPVKYGTPTTSRLTATVVEGGENNFTFELKD